MKRYLLCLALACGTTDPLPAAGSSCDCAHAGATDSVGLVCTPQCTPTTLQKAINGAPWCNGATVCFGEGCCTWQPPAEVHQGLCSCADELGHTGVDTAGEPVTCIAIAPETCKGPKCCQWKTDGGVM